MIKNMFTLSVRFAWYLVNRHTVKQCKDVGLSLRHQWIKGLMD